MARKAEIRGQVRAGLAKLHEASTCGSEERGEKLTLEGLAALYEVAYASEVPAREREAHPGRPTSLREAFAAHERRKTTGNLLDRMEIPRPGA